ncbi:MAG: sugar phosphate isomerase/epimerase, partial [Armatimonadetes bacterium]|nr:sugar phosphate isomerase/epimerase [Armatimonadota bacterium]
AVQAAEPPLERRIALFMDCLDHLDLSYREAAGHVRDLGFAGPDLTVRGGGVVAPEQAATELPRALAAFREAGLSVPMLSTNLTAAEDPTAEPILRGMQAHGVRFFKLGYLHYRNVARWQVEVEENRRRLRALGQLAARYGAQAGLHNHAGGNIGGAIWDGWELLAPLSPEHFGFYFDAGQATIEGGEHAWKLNFHRIVPRLKMVAIKDFVWEKREGRWRTRWVPLGEGMVRWPEFFALLRGASFPGPVSLHIEYDPGGNTRTEKIERTLAAAARDLTVLRRFLDAAPTPRPNS